MNIFKLAEAFLSIESMTLKKLQKLCYYAYAWYLAQTDEELFPNEFEAWVHGPVDPKLYQEYRNNRNYIGWSLIDKFEGDVNEDALTIAKWVYEAYGEYSGEVLEAISHQESPWINARDGRNPWESCKQKISTEDIKKYYRGLIG